MGFNSTETVDVNQLEERKNEILNQIEEFANGIIREKDRLAQVIFDIDKQIKHKKEKKYLDGVGQADIYNIETINNSSDTVASLIEKNTRYCRAYSTNPYRDNEKAEKASALLDELQEVAAQLDKYYNNQVVKANTDYENAKEALKATRKKRTKYRREVLSANGSLRKAGDYNTLGNVMGRYGSNEQRMNMLFGMIDSCHDGALICNSIKKAISIEQEAAKKDRQVIETPTVINTASDETIIVDGKPLNFTLIRENSLFMNRIKRK